MDTALLIIRVAVGLALAAHGAQKLFGWFGGPGIAGMAGWLESMGLRSRGYAMLAGAAELGGGLMFALGLFTPLAIAAVVGMMLAAIALVHWDKGFFATNGGYELPLMMMVPAIAVAVSGPGMYSVDAAIGLPAAYPLWGMIGVLVGVIAAAGVTALRSTALRGADLSSRQRTA